MKLSKSKTLYLVILLGCFSIAVADYKYAQDSALTYKIDPIQSGSILVVSNEQISNQNLKTNEEAYHNSAFVIPCD